MIKHLKNSVVEFIYWKPNVDNLAVAGDFSDWKPLQLKKDGRNYWTGKLELPAGEYKEYKFRYVSKNEEGKEEWFTDFAADGTEQNHSGLNSLIRIVEE